MIIYVNSIKTEYKNIKLKMVEKYYQLLIKIYILIIFIFSIELFI